MLQRRAFAKINLALFITDRLPNGYHLLETIFAPIDWSDTLSFEPSDRLDMTCDDDRLPSDDTNLCLKAAKSLKEAFGINAGVKIFLEKRIPYGAGLGGGSSDAAAVLNALNSFWHIDAPMKDLLALAVKLGADVPYFLRLRALAYATGIGDQLTDLETAFPFFIVVAFPNEYVSTAWAYQNLKLIFPRVAPDIKTLTMKLCETKDLDIFSKLGNDFESVVLEKHASVRHLKQIFRDLRADAVRMSGSGSAVFGVFEHEHRARAALDELSAEFPASLTPPNFTIPAD